MGSLIVNFVSSVFRLLEFAILLECILSWVVQDRNNGLMGILTSLTEPILRPFRGIQERFFGNLPVDISPIFAIVVLNLIQPIIISFLWRIF